MKGDKHWANTWTEIEDLGNGKRGATISVGHRVFFDKADGNKPKKHKLTDERPAKDYVLIQSAKCCVEVYPYYAKYFDVQHEEVRLYEERWICQRLFKEPDDWRDVGAYNPVMAVEEADDWVFATVTYQTDYGKLIVRYFQRDGNNLAHHIVFVNESGGTETFRVLQRWAGIVGGKCNGKSIPFDIEKPEEASFLAFHSADKPKREFNITNNLQGTLFNPNGTKKTEKCLQLPLKVETHAQGMKADFIFERWMLAPSEVLTMGSLYEYYITGKDNMAGVYEQHWYAQSFTPSIAHKITSVKLLLARKDVPGDLTVSIRATDGSGHPTGGDLCSGTTNGNTLTTSWSTGTWREITLGDGYDLVADTKYAIVVRALDANMDEMVYWLTDNTSPAYDRGCYERSDNSGVDWASYTGRDFLFEEWGEATGCPDAATLDDPNEDGHIEMSGGPTYTRDKLANILMIGGYGDDDYWYYDYRAYIEWNISSLAGGTLNINPVFKYHGKTNNATDEEINPLTEEAPRDATDANLYGYIASGTAYVNPFNLEVGTGKEVDLGASAKTDLQTAMDASQAWFAIGIQSPADEGTIEIGRFSEIYSEEKTDAADPKPTLYVEYTPAAGWTGKISGVVNPAKVMGVDVANIAKVKGVASA